MRSAIVVRTSTYRVVQKICIIFCTP